MTEDERELLKSCALTVGALAQALADGASLERFEEINERAIPMLGAPFERLFKPRTTNG